MRQRRRAGDVVHIIPREADFAIVKIYAEFSPDIFMTNRWDLSPTPNIDLRLDGRSCTPGSKLAFLEALRDWLQARYDEGDRTYAGLSAFIERARIEYLQPMEEA